jgi:hypothetical protein
VVTKSDQLKELISVSFSFLPGLLESGQASPLAAEDTPKPADNEQEAACSTCEKPISNSTMMYGACMRLSRRARIADNMHQS